MIFLYLPIDVNGSHNGCHCPPEFEGPHCEYLRDTTISNKHVHVKDSASAHESKRDKGPPEHELGQEIDTIEKAPQAPIVIQQVSTKKHNSHAPIASEVKSVLEEEAIKNPASASGADPVSPPALHSSVQVESISSLDNMPSNNHGGGGFFSISGALGGFALVVVGIAAITLRAKRQKLRKELLDRNTYKDETPIHLVSTDSH